MSGQTVKNVALSSDGSAVRIVDQTLLPGELRYIELRDREAMYEAIKTLRVRGAPAAPPAGPGSPPWAGRK